MKRRNYIDILFFLIIGILAVLWFKRDYIVGGDFLFPMGKIGSAWMSYANIWLDLWGAGLVSSRAIPILPFMALLSFIEHLGVSMVIAERLLFYFLFSFSGISIYCLVHILPFKEYKRQIAIFSALFYMFNPFNMIFYWHILDGMIFVYTVVPALLVLYLFWFKTQKLIYAVIFFIVTVFGGYAFPNTWMIPFMWVMFLVFTFIVNDGKKPWYYCIKFYVVVLILWTLINGWWIFPLLGSLREEFSGLSGTIGTPWDTLEAFSKQTSLMNLLRIGDLYWAFNDKLLGDFYYSFHAIYFTIPFILISFIYPIVIFSPLLLGLKPGSKLPRFMFSLYLTTLFIIFVAKGCHDPLGKEFYTILFRLPFFPSFRAPIHKLGVFLSMNYAILFGCGLVAIHNLLKKIVPNSRLIIMSILGLATLVIYPYPIWTGEMIQNGGKIYPSYHVKVPDYYYKAAAWVDSDRSYFRFYSLPQSPTFNVAYKWEHGYLGADPKQFIFSKPGIYATVEDFHQSPYIILHDKSSKDVYSLFFLQNVKYIILHNDTNEKLWDLFSGRKVSVEHLGKRLKEQNNLSFVRSFGKLDIYKISDEYFLPHVFVASKSIFINGNIEAFLPFNFIKNLAGSQNSPSLSKLQNSVVKITDINHEPQIVFKKINPSKYLVKIENAFEPFRLVLSESYNKGWKVYPVSGKANQNNEFEEIVADYPKLRIKEAKHLMRFTLEDVGYLFEKPLNFSHQQVNGYANSWYIEPRKLGLGENFTLVVYFLPQSLFYLGIAISILTLLGCIAVILWKRTNEK